MHSVKGLVSIMIGLPGACEPGFRAAELQWRVDCLLIFDRGGGGMPVALCQRVSQHNDRPSCSMLALFLGYRIPPLPLTT